MVSPTLYCKPLHWRFLSNPLYPFMALRVLEVSRFPAFEDLRPRGHLTAAHLAHLKQKITSLFIPRHRVATHTQSRGGLCLIVKPCWHYIWFCCHHSCKKIGSTFRAQSAVRAVLSRASSLFVIASAHAYNSVKNLQRRKGLPIFVFSNPDRRGNLQRLPPFRLLFFLQR